MKIYHSKIYLIEQLKKNKSYIKIAQKNNVDSSTIQRYLRRHNLTKKRISWTKEEIQLLKENYEFNPDLLRLLQNRSISSIYHKASKLRYERIARTRKYTINHNFFKEWNPEMAYILGLFFSDGNVSSNKQQISVHLNSNDHYFLEKVNKIIGSNRPVGNYSHSSYLRIDSKILANDLVKLGCIPRKSKSLRFPDIENEFLPHFVRGYFDGDGSIHFNKPNTIKVSFVGTKEFLKVMQFRISKALKLKTKPITKIKSIWRTYFYGNDARKLCEWMYKNSKDLYLERKKSRFEKHLMLRKKC